MKCVPAVPAVKGQNMAEETRRIRRRRRPFESAECRVCPLKGSAYCWRQCPYNLWRQQRIE